jgi:hypothetical protein
VIVIFQLPYSFQGIDINFNTGFQFCVCRINVVIPFTGCDKICNSAGLKLVVMSV